jgi:phage/plasmid-like protein (TIGR03299 family)
MTVLETVRSDPWAETGTTLEKVSSVSEALAKCGLDWSVSKRPVYLNTSTSHVIEPGEASLMAAVEIPNYFAIVRDDTEFVTGMVTGRFEPLQNHDGFSYLDSMLGEVEIVTAGDFDGGKTVWVLAKVPGHILVGGNPTEEFILFRNGHDGKTSVGYCMTPIVVVCKNTLSLAWKGTRNKFSVNHTGDMKERIKQAQEILGITSEYYDKYKQFGDKLATAKISDKKLLAIFMQLLYPNGVGDSDRAKNSAESAKLGMEQILSGPTLGNAKGTKWGALNAMGEYLDWYRPTRGDSDRFARINFEASNPKQKALELILDA